MNRKIWTGIVALLVVSALTVALTGTALAQEETPPPAPFYGHGFGHGPSLGRSLGGQVGLEAAADVLGMTADELSLELWGGKTLADLAEEVGIDLQVVKDAVDAALEAAKRDAIEQAVEDGTITRDHADWLLEGLDNGYMRSRGFGGFGGRGGRFGGGLYGSGMSGRFQNRVPSTAASDA